jgi:hypothetical protein
VADGFVVKTLLVLMALAHCLRHPVQYFIVENEIFQQVREEFL